MFNKVRLVLKSLMAVNVCGNSGSTSLRSISSCSTFFKSDDRRTLIASSPAKDEGTEGERSLNIDTLINSRSDMFPTEDTPNMLFNGLPFKNIPICNIKVSKNNTILSLTDKDGEIKMVRSCGIEGFKNTRKGTNIAAQATAITFATSAVNKGFGTIRVRVRGLGPGRMVTKIFYRRFNFSEICQNICLNHLSFEMGGFNPKYSILSAIKGLQMGGMNIISVTDFTPVSWNPPRPRKRRKL